MTLLLELCGRKGAGDSKATELLSTAASPSHASYLHHNSVCFHYSYFMWYPGMKEELFPSRWRAGYDWLSGRKAPNKMERGVLGGGWWCDGGALLDSKHQNRLHKQRRNISPESVMLSLL